MNADTHLRVIIQVEGAANQSKQIVSKSHRYFAMKLRGTVLDKPLPTCVTDLKSGDLICLIDSGKNCAEFIRTETLGS